MYTFFISLDFSVFCFAPTLGAQFFLPNFKEYVTKTSIHDTDKVRQLLTFKFEYDIHPYFEGMRKKKIIDVCLWAFFLRPAFGRIRLDQL